MCRPEEADAGSFCWNVSTWACRFRMRAARSAVAVKESPDVATWELILLRCLIKRDAIPSLYRWADLTLKKP